MRNRVALLCSALMLFASQSSWAVDDNPAYLELTGRYFELIRVVETRLANGEPTTATLLGPLCIAYARVKAYTKLFDCADTLDARVKAGDWRIKHMWSTVSDANASPVSNMLRAEAHLEFGEFDKSIDEGLRALGAIQGDGYDGSFWPPVKYRLTILANLVVASANAGQQQQSSEFLEKLRDVSIPFIGRSNWAPVRANGLARAYMANKQYEQVVEELSGGLIDRFVLDFSDTLSKAGWVNKDDSIKTIFELPKLFMLGKSQLELGRTNDAKKTFDTLLANPRLRDVGDIHRLALYERGRISASEGDTAGAIEYWKRAIEIIEQQRSTLNSEANKIGFVGDKQVVYQRLIATLFAESQYAVAFEYIERAKARALVDMLASKQDFSVATANTAEVRTLLARANTAEAEGRAQDASAEAAGQRSLAVQTRQQLHQQAPELSSLVSVTPVTVQEIQGRLPADEVLVEYYAEGKEVYAFVLSKAGLQGIKLNGEGLTADIQQFRQVLQDTRSTAHGDLAGKLYNRLMKPLEGAINQRNVLIVAHGPLHYLPFNALHDGNGYLIERYSVRLLPSASVLKYLKGVKPQTTGTLLAFGNPDLGDPQLDLKYAQAEAMNVAKVLPNSKALVRREASESAFKRYGEGFKYLHIASHGTFNADSPLTSALLLTKDSTNDGTLTVGELYSMRLNADLVTLSACETGLGKIANGDDVVGLTRGFLYAGSRSIVASLWKVDDEATAYLMTRFYGALKGTSKREALRLAQIETRKKYPHPYYWAAFQLTGEAS